MNKRLQGDVGLAAAIYYYTSHGYNVSVPFSEATRYDALVENGELKRVQCKTTNYKSPSGHYIVTLRTTGYRSGKTVEVKRISCNDCDELFVLDGDGNMYVVPAKEVQGMASITLGKNWRDYRVIPKLLAM